MDELNSKENKKKGLFESIDWIVFLPAFLIITFCVIPGFYKKDLFLKGLLIIHSWVSENFGWPYVLVIVGSLVLSIVLIFHPFGKIKLGGEDAKPELSTFAWFCITLTSTIGVALIF